MGDVKGRRRSLLLRLRARVTTSEWSDWRQLMVDRVRRPLLLREWIMTRITRASGVRGCERCADRIVWRRRIER